MSNKTISFDFGSNTDNDADADTDADVAIHHRCRHWLTQISRCFPSRRNLIRLCCAFWGIFVALFLFVMPHLLIWNGLDKKFDDGIIKWNSGLLKLILWVILQFQIAQLRIIKTSFSIIHLHQSCYLCRFNLKIESWINEGNEPFRYNKDTMLSQKRPQNGTSLRLWLS